jgi:ATP-dependent DNA ligase
MSVNWGPQFIVPSEAAKHFRGIVVLRETLDERLLREELQALGFEGAVVKVTNPWYYREKGTETWIKIGESDVEAENFPVRWDTSKLKNGPYEVLGLMHVFVARDKEETIIARQNIVEVTVEN